MVEANPAARKHRLGAGEILRHWRDLRGHSQLKLSLTSGVSQRHISFIESGRNSPSRQILLDLAESLDIPLRDRNALLLAAGYAPAYSEGAWEDDGMTGIATALKRMLQQAEPYPAVVMDRYWNVLMTNDALPRMFNCFTDTSTWTGRQNILHTIFDPTRLRPYIADWNQLAISLIHRVYREAIGRHIDQKTNELLDALLAYPDVPSEWKTPKGIDAPIDSPVVPLALMKDGKAVRFFSMVTTVGTPQTVAGQELRMEWMLPVDEESEQHYKLLLARSVGK